MIVDRISLQTVENPTGIPEGHPDTSTHSLGENFLFKNWLQRLTGYITQTKLCLDPFRFKEHPPSLDKQLPLFLPLCIQFIPLGTVYIISILDAPTKANAAHP